MSAPLKKKCRLQQVFGDKLKVEEKLQVLDALISVCEQKSDLVVDFLPEKISTTNEFQSRNQPQTQGHYACEICSKSFKSSSQYYGHLATHKRESWICVQCPKKDSLFKSLAHLRKHEKSCHSTSKEYKCKYCNDTFLNSSSREYHQNHMHTEFARFACQFCDKTFYKRSDLRTHLATHLSLRGSVCEVCGRSFSHISNLIRHSYLHTGVKPYPCKICGWRFTQLTSLKQHKMSHHENLSIPCPALPHQCGKVFRTPILARQHAYRVHPGILWESSIPKSAKQKQKRNFYCRECGETFEFAKDLKSHNSDHQKDKAVPEKDCKTTDDATNATNFDSKSLQFSSENNSRGHGDGSVEDCAIEFEKLPICGSAYDFLATIQEISCSSFLFGNIDLGAIASSDTLTTQQITNPTPGKSKPNPELHEMEESTQDDNQFNCLFKLKVEQKNQNPEMESFNLKKVVRNDQTTEVAYLQTEDLGKCVTSAQLRCINVEGETTNCNELADYQCLRIEDDSHNSNLMESLSSVNKHENMNQLTVLSSLNMHNDNQRQDNELTSLKRMSVHGIHCLDTDIQMSEPRSMNLLDSDEHVSQLTEIQCLNFQESEPNVDSFIPSYQGDAGNEDSCSIFLNELELQDQCLSVTEDSCSTLLNQLECQNICLQVTEDTCPDLFSGIGQEDHTNSESTNQISESILLSFPDTDTEKACSTLVNGAEGQNHCLNLRSDNLNSGFCIPSLSPIEISGLSVLSETEQENGYDNESAITPEQFILMTEFPKDIISLLPETSDGPEDIVIYVSQEDGAPAEVRIKPIMTTVVTRDSVDFSVADETDVHDDSSFTNKTEVHNGLQSQSIEMKSPNRTKRKCPECGKIFYKISNLRQHLGTHFPNMQGYECDVCNQSFAWKSTLNKHMTSSHAIVLRQYLCDLCGKQYNTITQVKEHKRRDHQSLRPNTCSVCNKSFFRKYDLYIHQRIHTNKKPYMCDTCGKTFNHLSHLKRHERVHQSIKNYDCDTCGCSFAQRSSLKLHWENDPSCKM